MSNKYDVNNDLHNEKTNAADAVVRMLIAKLAQELPQEENENFVRKQIWVTLSDGVRLICDVHLPDGEGPWPVILQREERICVCDDPLPGYRAFRGESQCI